MQVLLPLITWSFIWTAFRKNTPRKAAITMSTSSRESIPLPAIKSRKRASRRALLGEEYPVDATETVATPKPLGSFGRILDCSPAQRKPVAERWETFKLICWKRLKAYWRRGTKRQRTSSRKKTNHHRKLPPRPQKIPNLSVKLRPQQYLRQTREVRKRISLERLNPKRSQQNYLLATIPPQAKQ